MHSYTIAELRNSGIYSITHINSSKRYIGSTKNFYKRLSVHISTLDNNKHDNNYLQRIWNEVGKSEFTFEILELTNNLLEREQYWMDFYQSYDNSKGFNLGTFAVNYMLGNTHSVEVRAKISDKAKGRVMSQDVKEKISERLRGKAHSYKKGCVKHPEIYKSPARKKPIKERHLVNTYYVTSPEGIKYVFDNLAEFCRQHNLTRSHFTNALKNGGFYKGWKGYIVRTKN